MCSSEFYKFAKVSFMKQTLYTRSIQEQSPIQDAEFLSPWRQQEERPMSLLEYFRHKKEYQMKPFLHH